MGTKISALAAATTLGDSDVVAAVVSGVTKKITAANLKETLDINDKFERWKLEDSGNYTATPASTSRLTMSDTSNAKVGLPVKYADPRGTYYAIITAVSSSTYIDIAGGPLSAVNDLTALSFGLPEMVVQVDFFVADLYGDDIADLLATDMNTYFSWGAVAAYLVAISATQATVDTGAEPKINVLVNAVAVSTEDSNNGLQLGAAGTWVIGSPVALDTSRYDIQRGEAIEIRCTAVGGSGDASDLTVRLLFVLE